MYLIVVLALLFGSCGLTDCRTLPDEFELKLVSMLFRHGDRTRTQSGKEFVPSDPYSTTLSNITEAGQLTPKGMRRMFNVGKLLRKRYSSFVGPVYYPSMIEARSTSSDRAKMSLQLVLGGLFHRIHPAQKWSNETNWQPFAVTYQDLERDTLLMPDRCPSYRKEKKRVLALSEVKAKIGQFSYMMDYLQIKSGKPMSSLTDLYHLYHGYMCSESMGLPKPEWIEDCLSDGSLEKAVNLQYELMNYNDDMKRLNGGILLRKISLDMIYFIKNELPKNRKVFLYVGHETTVVALMKALGLQLVTVPRYTSGITIELHSKKGQYYVKIMYYMGEPPVFVEQNIPGCPVMCPLNEFLQLLSPVISSEEEASCI